MTEHTQTKDISQPKRAGLEALTAVLTRYEFLIPTILFAIFLILTLPGISWGAPDTWHPDEIVIRSIKALHGEWRFSEVNFDYPDLPQYAMFALGKVILALGYGDGEVLVSSRVLSALLAGATVILAYVITRKFTNNIYIAGLSSLLLVSVSAMTHNARFAHNDTYILFFATLTLFFLIQYKLFNQRGWLYASFLSVGMAASSKYNGVSLLIVPVIVYLVSQRKVIFKQPLRTLETLFIGGALTVLGYAAGTPKALFWMTYYFKRMIPALLHTGNYARQPGSVRGVIGQYASLASGVGLPLFLLFSVAVLWACHRVYRQRSNPNDSQAPLIGIVLLTILALDLPIMISYNFPARFFLSMMPAFAILGALFVQDVYQWAAGRSQVRIAIAVVLSLCIAYSLARNVSVMLLFFNDPRIPASEFIQSLPAGTSLEHTYYPPGIPAQHFKRQTNYPIYFPKDPNEVVLNKKFNIGEESLYERNVDYLVVDGFTSDKFKSEYTCGLMQLECDFFKQLATGQSNHYKLMAEFSYSLPSYLPQLEIDFVNPSIRIYERIP